jgi:hypothetical protein
MKIKEYKIVSGSTVTILEASVVSSINEGWQPFGGIVFGQNTEIYSKRLYGYQYSQAMVIYEE